MSSSDNLPASADGAFAKSVFGTDDVDVDTASAYRSVMLRAAARRNDWRGAAAAGLAAAVVCALILTPLGGYAMQMLTIFEPREFVPVAISPVDREQLRLAPEVDAFGVASWDRHAKPRGTSLAKATALAGFSPRLPGPSATLPSGRARYTFVPAATLSFTFSAVKAAAYERRFHRRLPQMPPGLDGSTVRIATGPGIMVTYDERSSSSNSQGRRSNGQRVVLVQMRTPRVASTGASIEVLEEYLLSLPNVPADVAKQLRAISNPSTMLPLPFQIDKTTATPVDVDDVHGLALGDQTGLGSGVLWQKRGILYALGGTLKESDALSMADGLR